jgi:hypothetical protein
MHACSRREGAPGSLTQDFCGPPHHAHFPSGCDPFPAARDRWPDYGTFLARPSEGEGGTRRKPAQRDHQRRERCSGTVRKVGVCEFEQSEYCTIFLCLLEDSDQGCRASKRRVLGLCTSHEKGPSPERTWSLRCSGLTVSGQPAWADRRSVSLPASPARAAR